MGVLTNRTAAAKVTIMIPTKDRADFVVRLLRYYKGLSFQGRIIIGDSSGDEEFARVAAEVERIGDKLEINQHAYPGMNNALCIQQMLDVVQTPYATLLPDDDFQVPNGIADCVEFLDGHPDYNSAHGRAIIFVTETPGAHGVIQHTGAYPLPVIAADSAECRVVELLSNYRVALFSVHRIESWKMMYRDVTKIEDKTFVLELLPNCLSLVGGKSMELDCFYLARQVHEQRYLLPDIFDWITGSEWQASYALFRDCLAEQLARVDDIDIARASEIVKLGFWAYLGKGLVGKWKDPHAVEVKSKAEALGRIPGVQPILRSMEPTRRRNFECSLAQLQKKSSYLHRDFTAIYRAAIGE